MSPSRAHRQRPRVNWDELRLRIARAGRRIAGDEDEDDAASRVRILHERARAAARPAAPAVDLGTQLQVVEFVLAYERYAIDVGSVREVVALRELTPLPSSPVFVAGLVNVRGRIVPVVDLKAFFGLPSKGLPDLNRVLVMGRGSLEFGLLVDGVAGAAWVGLDRLQPPPPTFTGRHADYLRGLTSDRVAVLDGARLLSDPRIVPDRTASP